MTHFYFYFILFHFISFSIPPGQLVKISSCYVIRSSIIDHPSFIYVGSSSNAFTDTRNIQTYVCTVIISLEINTTYLVKFLAVVSSSNYKLSPKGILHNYLQVLLLYLYGNGNRLMDTAVQLYIPMHYIHVVRDFPRAFFYWVKYATSHYNFTRVRRGIPFPFPNYPLIEL